MKINSQAHQVENALMSQKKQQVVERRHAMEEGVGSAQTDFPLVQGKIPLNRSSIRAKHAPKRLIEEQNQTKNKNKLYVAIVMY